MQTVPAVESTSAGDISIGDLIDRAADLKGELLAFAQSPGFVRQLNARLSDAADRRGYLDEGTVVFVVDRFALQDRFSDGRTLVERFVAQRRPRLSDDEREMMLGWRDVVEGCFEVRGFDGDAVLLHNLLDDLVYRAYSNMGRGAFARLRKGMFVGGRIVPVHPATDAWLISGHLVVSPKSERQRMARVAAEQLMAHPELLWRNPAMLELAWEIQAQRLDRRRTPRRTASHDQVGRHHTSSIDCGLVGSKATSRVL